MSPNLRFGHLAKFLTILLFIFLKNLLVDFLYQHWEVMGWDSTKYGFFFAGFETVDWLLFWLFFKDILDKSWKTLLMFAATVVLTTIPDFLNAPFWSYDHDNLLLKSFLYFIPFLIFLFLKKSISQMFLPVMMAFIPLINLEIANGFWGALPFLKNNLLTDYWIVNLSSDLFLDIKLALIKTFYWASFAILFFEISHQFFVWKSWRLHVELPLKRGYLIVVFIVFKSIIYWLAGSLIIVLLGDKSIPLFTNKLGIFLNGIGFFGYLIISVLYFRKYMTMYFYDKIGHSNWLYPLFFFPLVDLIAFVIILLLPPRYIRTFFKPTYSKQRLIALIIVLLLGYAAYSFVTFIMVIPSNQTFLRSVLLSLQVLIPVIIALGIALAVNKRWAYRGLLTLLVLLVPVYYFILGNAQIYTALKIEKLVEIVSLYVHLGIIVAFLYPVINFKSFLKLDS